jgi:hypothetical protein
MISKSKISFSVWGNPITAMVRSVLAVTAHANKPYMAVTDSLVLDHGMFISSKYIHTSYKKLNHCFHHFDWECDFSDVHFAIHRERSYFYLLIIICFQYTLLAQV